MDPLRFYRALYMITRQIDACRDAIQKENFPDAMLFAAEISTQGKKLYNAIDAANRQTFKCPVCGAISYNPNDKKEGYCGRCHDWTGGQVQPR